MPPPVLNPFDLALANPADAFQNKQKQASTSAPFAVFNANDHEDKTPPVAVLNFKEANVRVTLTKARQQWAGRHGDKPVVNFKVETLGTDSYKPVIFSRTHFVGEGSYGIVLALNLGVDKVCGMKVMFETKDVAKQKEESAMLDEFLESELYKLGASSKALHVFPSPFYNQLADARYTYNIGTGAPRDGAGVFHVQIMPLYSEIPKMTFDPATSNVLKLKKFRRGLCTYGALIMSNNLMFDDVKRANFGHDARADAYTRVDFDAPKPIGADMLNTYKLRLVPSRFRADDVALSARVGSGFNYPLHPNSDEHMCNWGIKTTWVDSVAALLYTMYRPFNILKVGGWFSTPDANAMVPASEDGGVQKWTMQLDRHVLEQIDLEIMPHNEKRIIVQLWEGLTTILSNTYVVPTISFAPSWVQEEKTKPGGSIEDKLAYPDNFKAAKELMSNLGRELWKA